MKHTCPQCGHKFDEIVIDGNAIPVRIQEGLKDVEWKLIMPTDFLMPQGTCNACMRGDCELQRKGISHT